MAESSTEQKAAYDKWERSNRISLMIMKGSIMTAIHGAIPDSDNAKLYLTHIEEQFQGSSKAHVTTLITKMVTLKYSGFNSVREHILRMNDMASQLKGLDLKISEGAIVHITNSLRGFFFVKKLNKGDCNVLVGNGEKAQVEAVGTLRLVLESGFNLDLVDTVYVPSMTRNLIYVSRLHAYGYSFKFENKGTPQQNGVAERQNRTLMDMVRSMICQSTLPEFLWVEALKTAVHILNRVLSYFERFKDFKFYCSSHTTRIVETRHAVFFKDAEYSGSSTPILVNLEEIQDHVFIPVIQKVGTPLPHIEDNDAPEVVPNDVPSITDPAPIPANEQPLRRLIDPNHLNFDGRLRFGRL
ncbi:hypothetical protein RJ639_014878 [Escallonia herrerae]|uniref:Retrovirus-related Pol polyprotein from transposon TNT 1-94-like beta-barrel domain-containing protein n=1 Tax=Escallonia herrerae TaxID=1293975 RepID=A0AA88VFB9_9ASTE|nr:hypothetical protein RJ639_014878 [Escallonia herrerae]